jgi:hypothetical protein
MSRNRKTNDSLDRKIAFERKLDKNGKQNSKYVDLLDVDKPIAGQTYVCLSFVSPEKIIKQKEHFFFEEFLKKWEMNKSMEKFTQFLNFVSYKYKLTFDDMMKDFEEFCKEEREAIVSSSIDDDFRTFLDNNEEDLQKKFDLKHNFQTSTRGIKIRGAFPTQEEAEMRCKMLREVDPNHDIMVGEVGVWMPWEIEAYKTGRVEYLEEELNQLMHEKTKNEKNAKTAFEQRVKETKQKAIEDNIKNAEKSGNTLTQTIDENGNLIGVGVANTQETTLKSSETISVADIRSELFEGENIVVGQTDNGRSELISGPFAIKKGDGVMENTD